jgi:hypothetical protein
MDVPVSVPVSGLDVPVSGLMQKLHRLLHETEPLAQQIPQLAFLARVDEPFRHQTQPRQIGQVLGVAVIVAVLQPAVGLDAGRMCQLWSIVVPPNSLGPVHPCFV